jgi:hypothetical protein
MDLWPIECENQPAICAGRLVTRTANVLMPTPNSPIEGLQDDSRFRHPICSIDSSCVESLRMAQYK